jgi:DNA-binding MarR family transcriptional regulator
MTLQQLEYVLAVDNYRQFALAAEKSFVTQPTLSMMLKKLEDELGIKIFDRGKKPVVPTREGEEVIRRARTGRRTAFRYYTHAGPVPAAVVFKVLYPETPPVKNIYQGNDNQ